MFQTVSTNEREFLYEAIKADCRVDARTANETRLLRQAYLNAKNQECGNEQIRFGSENGQVMVKVGHTKVIT